jgi:Domain of unknown function (DUF6249)
MQPAAGPSCRTNRKGEIPGKEEVMAYLGVFLVPIVTVVTVFTFAAIVHWVDSQRKEREAYYKAETLRRVTEASGEGAKAAAELMREDERLKQLKKREGMKIAGVINIGVGIGTLIFLHVLMPGAAFYLGGLIPGFVGVGFLLYVYLLAAPVE